MPCLHQSTCKNYFLRCHLVKCIHISDIKRMYIFMATYKFNMRKQTSDPQQRPRKSLHDETYHDVFSSFLVSTLHLNLLAYNKSHLGKTLTDMKTGRQPWFCFYKPNDYWVGLFWEAELFIFFTPMLRYQEADDKDVTLSIRVSIVSEHLSSFEGFLLSSILL